MYKQLLLLSLLTIFVTEGNARRHYKTPAGINISTTQSLPRKVCIDQNLHEKALSSLRTEIAKRKAVVDPTLEVRKANSRRKAVALDENSYGLRLDSIVTPGVSKRVITSDPNRNRWTHEDQYSWQDNQWVLTEKIDYSYDMGGVTLTTYHQYDDPNAVATRYTSDYDANGNQTLEIVEHIPAGQTEWMCDSKFVAKYYEGGFELDAEMREYPLCYEVWTGGENPGEWVLLYKYVTEYDKQGRLTYEEMQQFDGTQLQGQATRVTRGEGNSLTSDVYTLYNGEWVLIYKGTLDVLGRQVGALDIIVDDDGNVLQQIETGYEYNADNEMNIYERKKVGDGEWYDLSKTFFTYDSHGTMLANESWIFDEEKQELVLDYKKSYTNDSDGHHVKGEEGWRDSDTNLWRDVYTYTYNYIADNQYEEFCYDLEEEKYVVKMVSTLAIEPNRYEVSNVYYIYDTATSAYETEANRSLTLAYNDLGWTLLYDHMDSYGKERTRIVTGYSPSGKYEDRDLLAWEDGQLTTGYKKVFGLDDKERILTYNVTRYDASTSQWYVDTKEEMGYDDDGYINHYRYISRYNDGVYLSTEGYDIEVTRQDDLVNKARINYSFLNPEWVLSDKSEEVKNQWGETVQTCQSDYVESTGMWFVREQGTYNFDTTQYGCNILGGGQNHYMVTNYHLFNSDADRYSTYYYSETVPEIEVTESEPIVIAINSDIFMIEVEIKNPEQPEIIPILTADYEAVILEEETIVAVSVPAPIEVPEVQPTFIPLFFTPYSESQDAPGKACKAKGLNDNQTLVIKAGSLSFNQLVYQHDIEIPINVDESLLTGISDIEQTSSPSTATIYDLSGRPITITAKRIYIQNGKKYIRR